MSWTDDIRARKAGRPAALAVAVATAVLLTAAAAGATTYYVSTTGNDGLAGTSPATAWATIAKANSTAGAGDIVLIGPGTYVDGINPSKSGTSSSRINFLGNLTNPALVTVASVQITGQDYISIKGVTSVGDIGMQANSSGNAAMYDSVAYCVGQRGLGLSGAWYCTVANNVIGDGNSTDKLWIGVYPGDNKTANASITAYCTLVDNQFNFATVSGSNAMNFQDMRNNLFLRNRNTLTLLPGAVDTHSNTYYRVKNNRFVDCSYTLKNFATFEVYIFNLRDSSSFNSWTRDTFQVDPASTMTIKFEFQTSGAYPGSCVANTWSNCLIHVDGICGWQMPGREDQLFGNTFILKNEFDARGDSLVIRHNTFYTQNSLCFSAAETELTNTTLTSNIFYATGPANITHNYIPDVASVRSDSNLVFSSGNDPGKAVYLPATSGNSQVGPGTPWCTTWGKDCASKWSDPQFTSTSWFGTNLRPANGSIAFASSWADGYVGAIPFAAPVTDQTPPAAVTNLAALQTGTDNVVLGWTAPGDDGNVGTAAQYDLRRSSAPITDASFASATALGPLPAPLPAGLAQTYVVLGLTPSTTYYYALKTRDLVGNWSSISNVLTVTTPAVDSTPPAAVTDLSVGP